MTTTTTTTTIRCSCGEPVEAGDGETRCAAGHLWPPRVASRLTLTGSGRFEERVSRALDGALRAHLAVDASPDAARAIERTGLDGERRALTHEVDLLIERLARAVGDEAEALRDRIERFHAKVNRADAARVADLPVQDHLRKGPAELLERGWLA